MQAEAMEKADLAVTADQPLQAANNPEPESLERDFTLTTCSSEPGQSSRVPCRPVLRLPCHGFEQWSTRTRLPSLGKKEPVLQRVRCRSREQACRPTANLLAGVCVGEARHPGAGQFGDASRVVTQQRERAWSALQNQGLTSGAVAPAGPGGNHSRVRHTRKSPRTARVAKPGPPHSHQRQRATHPVAVLRAAAAPCRRADGG